MTISVETGPGRPKDAEVRHAIPIVLKELGMANPERIRQAVSEFLKRSVSWNTVNSALIELSNQGSLVEQVVTRGSKRKISVYRLFM